MRNYDEMELGLKEVKGVRISDNMSVDSLVKGLRDCAFGAGRLAKAVDIYEEMLKEEVTKFIGIAGALVPAGMRNIIADMIKERYVDVVVTTGANIVHDIIEALGDHHYKINATNVDDVTLLRKHEMDRIYDVVIYEEAFTRLEHFLHTIFKKSNRKIRNIKEFLRMIGENIQDRNSILKSAVDSDVPVFCPAIADSMIGLHTWIYKQTNTLNVDTFEDIKDIIDVCHEARRTGAIILGGGVPKNFIFQTTLLAPMPKQGFDYVVQITTETPENGSLSGATLEEAKSWGKVGEKAKTVTVHCDATIALPVIIAAVRERMKKEK